MRCVSAQGDGSCSSDRELVQGRNAYRGKQGLRVGGGHASCFELCDPSAVRSDGECNPSAERVAPLIHRIAAHLFEPKVAVG